MKTKTVSLAPIAAGMEISIPGCVGFFKVLRRTGPGRYEVDFKGQKVIVRRQLDTLVKPAGTEAARQSYTQGN